MINPSLRGDSRKGNVVLFEGVNEKGLGGFFEFRKGLGQAFLAQARRKRSEGGSVASLHDRLSAVYNVA